VDSFLVLYQLFSAGLRKNRTKNMIQFVAVCNKYPSWALSMQEHPPLNRDVRVECDDKMVALCCGNAKESQGWWLTKSGLPFL
jgi:hypothetical protein